MTDACIVKVVMMVTELKTPANMRRLPNVGSLLGQRRKRWASSKPTYKAPGLDGLPIDFYDTFGLFLETILLMCLMKLLKPANYLNHKNDLCFP